MEDDESEYDFGVDAAPAESPKEPVDPRKTKYIREEGIRATKRLISGTILFGGIGFYLFG